MRAIVGLLLVSAAALCAAGAQAQTAVLTANPAADATPTDDLALFKAAFAPASDFVAVPADAGQAAPTLKVDANGAGGGAFILPAYSGTGVNPAELAGAGRLVNGQGLAVSSTREVSVTEPGGAVDSVRMTVNGLQRAPGGVVLAAPGGLFAADTQDVDLRYTRGWPSLLKLSAGGYGLEVSPHAGFGVSSNGGSAEAGATVRFGTGAAAKIAHGLGLRTVDPDSFAGKGRWYLFAAASGQALGLNMTGNGQGGVQRGWTSETTNSVSTVSDAQAGVGWRKGDMLASFGYIHREIRGVSDPQFGPANQGKFSDSMVALSLSLHPH
jgi:hypothetical protein